MFEYQGSKGLKMGPAPSAPLHNRGFAASVDSQEPGERHGAATEPGEPRSFDFFPIYLGTLQYYNDLTVLPHWNHG